MFLMDALKQVRAGVGARWQPYRFKFQDASDPTTRSGFEVKTLHHLPAAGGTIISKCLAAMPQVVLLSEINPLSPGPIRFNPFDPIQQLQARYNLLREDQLKEIFLNRLDCVVKTCQGHNLSLIIRDHAYSDFLRRKPRKYPPLVTFAREHYAVRPAVTLRHPVDSYLAMIEKNWHRYVGTFDAYCRRYLIFTEAYEACPVFKYEDFVSDPAGTLRQICAWYGIRYDPTFEQRIGQIKLTGDSGRKSDRIEERPRRPFTEAFAEEVKKSSHFAEITARFGYSF